MSAAKVRNRPTVEPVSRLAHLQTLLSLNWEPEMRDYWVLMADGVTGSGCVQRSPHAWMSDCFWQPESFCVPLS